MGPATYASKRDVEGLTKRVTGLEKSLATAVEKMETLSKYLDAMQKKHEGDPPALTTEEVQRLIGDAVATSAATAPQPAPAVVNPSGGSRGIYTTLKEMTDSTKRVESLVVE